MNRQPIASNLLKSFGYEDGVLEVEFAKNGNIYRYAGVDQALFDKFQAADSKGSFFLKEINRKFDATRVEEAK